MRKLFSTQQGDWTTQSEWRYETALSTQFSAEQKRSSQPVAHQNQAEARMTVASFVMLLTKFF